MSTLPAFKYFVLLSCGIIAGNEIPMNRACIAVVLFTTSALIILFRWNLMMRSALCFALIFATGFMKSNADIYNLPGNSTALISETAKNETVVLTGVVNDIPDHDSTRIRFTINSSSIIAKDTIQITGEILVTANKSRNDTFDLVLKPGDILEIRGAIVEPPGSRNPGEFDYRRYLFLKGIYKTFRVSGYSNVKIISEGKLSFVMQDIIYPSRKYSVDCIERQSKGDEAQFLKGLVTGDRSDISDDIRQAFMNAGVSHLIAVSGLNVAYLILTIALACSMIKLNKTATLLTVITFLIFYCNLTGNTASILRASLMGGSILIASRIQRIPQFYNFLGVSGCVILLYDSRLLFDAGFILSFTATFSMVWIFEKIDGHFIRAFSNSGTTRTKIVKNLLTAFFTTFAAQVGTLPVTAMYFGKVSLISLFVNIAAVPLANISLAIGFMQIALSLVSESVAQLSAETNNLLLSLQLRIIQFAADLPLASVYVREIDLTIICAMYLAIILIATSKNLHTLIFRTFISITIAGILFNFSFHTNENLIVTTLDVGQGDCIVIQTPNGKCIVVDCGNSANGFDSGERTLAPFLRRKGIKTIDVMILTHNHADHIGGANHIIDNFEIGRIIHSPDGMEESMASGVYHNAETRGILLHRAAAGETIEGLGETKIYVLFPHSHSIESTRTEPNHNINNSSVVFLLKYRETEMLFTGDIESEAEVAIAEMYGTFISADILKSAHHGSSTSSTPVFLAATRPDAALISCGSKNKFGHPSGEVIQRLNFMGTDVFRTDRSGGITLISDGYNIEVEPSYYLQK